MTQRIIRNVKILTLPEDAKRKELITQLTPILSELAKLNKSEKQEGIDATILKATGDLMKMIRESGLSIDMEDIFIGPLWSDVNIVSERKSIMKIEYQEPTNEHTTNVKTNIVINCNGISIGTKISCSVTFEEFKNPDNMKIISLNEDISQMFSTDVVLLRSDKTTLSRVEDNVTGQLDLRQDGGIFEVSFEIILPFETSVNNVMETIKKTSDKYAKAEVFEKGNIVIKTINTNGYSIKDPIEVSERQFLEDFIDL